VALTAQRSSAAAWAPEEVCSPQTGPIPASSLLRVVPLCRSCGEDDPALFTQATASMCRRCRHGRLAAQARGRASKLDLPQCRLKHETAALGLCAICVVEVDAA
jgi:hypothetical protein